MKGLAIYTIIIQILGVCFIIKVILDELNSFADPDWFVLAASTGFGILFCLPILSMGIRYLSGRMPKTLAVASIAIYLFVLGFSAFEIFDSVRSAANISFIIVAVISLPSILFAFAILRKV